MANLLHRMFRTENQSAHEVDKKELPMGGTMITLRPSHRPAFIDLAKQTLLLAGTASAFLVQPTQAASDVAPFLNEPYSRQFDECMKRVGAVTAFMHECYGDEYGGVLAALESAYQSAVAEFPARARNEFRRSEWRWRRQMKIACENDPAVEDVAGGSLVPFVITSCIISRIKARTKGLRIHSLHQ